MLVRSIARQGVALSLSLLWLVGCATPLREPGTVLDEARVANRPAASFPAADEDFFRDMDGGIPLTQDEIKGRNTWIVWTGGNDRFWDVITQSAFGSFDLLKIVS